MCLSMPVLAVYVCDDRFFDVVVYVVAVFFFFKQKTAYEMRISDWSSDVCSSDLPDHRRDQSQGGCPAAHQPGSGAGLFGAGRISTGQINGGGLHHHHVLGNGSGGRAVSLPRPQNLAPLHGVAVPPGTRRNVQLRTCSVRADQGWRSSIGILVS